MDQYTHHGTSRRKEKGTKRFYEEIMAENFPNLWKEMDIQIQELSNILLNLIYEDWLYF